jgi:hypothetical protein
LKPSTAPAQAASAQQKVVKAVAVTGFAIGLAGLLWAAAAAVKQNRSKKAAKKGPQPVIHADE